MSPLVGTVLLVVFIALVVLVISRSIRIVPQATAGIVERFGRYHRTLNAGLNMVTPFVDRLRPLIDLREQVVSFPPQPVITRDNLVVSIDTVIYFQVTDARAATYEVANYITAVEQLTVTTLRNVVGGMELEHALTSRVDHKTDLQELLARTSRQVAYTEVSVEGPPHERRFTCAAIIDGEELGRGEGQTKKEAEQEAAREALSRLGAAEP